MPMYNPAHPGKVLRERLGSMSVSAADHFRVSRVTRSRLINGKAGVSAAMALRLAEAFSTTPDFWLKLQMNYDLWPAAHKRRRRVQPIRQDAV